MGHGHSHTHSHSDTEGNMKTAFWLNLLFTVVELVGGLLTNSVAILSDAVHDLGDSVSIGVSLWLERYAKRRPTPSFTYGYRRFSVLGALINSMVLLVGSTVILVNVIPRFIHPEEVNSGGMIWLAVVGCIVNGVAVLKLRRGKSVNQRAIMLHLMEDVLGWAAVLVGAVVMYFTGWMFIDPLLSVAISVFILVNVFRNLKSVFSIFLQSAPVDIDRDELIAELKKIPGVEDIHDIHFWSLDGLKNIGSIHIVVGNSTDSESVRRIRTEVRQTMKSAGVDHPTIEIEYADELTDCTDHCDCK